VLLSEYTPVAIICSVRPLAIFGMGGETSSETKVGAPTVKVVEPLTPFKVAEIVVVPGANALSLPSAATVAMSVLLEAQAT
jgi:hypothetical protein